MTCGKLIKIEDGEPSPRLPSSILNLIRSPPQPLYHYSTRSRSAAGQKQQVGKKKFLPCSSVAGGWTHWAITPAKPQNLHFFPRTRHRRPFLYLAPCGGSD